MDIVLKKATAKAGMAELAAEALRARLFVPGWALSGELQDLKESAFGENYDKSIVVAYMDSVPIGVCLSLRWFLADMPFLMTFVRKKHRRLGIGTKLVRKVMGRKKGFKYSYGLKTAARFFDRFPNAEHND